MDNNLDQQIEEYLYENFSGYKKLADKVKEQDDIFSNFLSNASKKARERMNEENHQEELWTHQPLRGAQKLLH